MDKIFNRKHLNIFCLLIVIFFCSCNPFPQITTEEAKEIKNICDNLKPPPFFSETRRRDSEGRSHMAVYTIQYSSLASPKDVEEYYIDLLTKTGWNYHKEYEPAEEVLQFGKYSYSISVYTPKISLSQRKVYLVSCSVCKAPKITPI